MITINSITKNEVQYLSGKIGKTPYLVVFSEEVKTALLKFSASYNKATIYADAQTVLEEALEVIKTAKTMESSSVKEVLKGDLQFDQKLNKYFIIVDGKVSKVPVHNFFVKKMVEANEKGLSPKPWLIFWVRLMRNPLYIDNKIKVENIVAYLEAQYVDKDHVELLKAEGYSEKMAKSLSTFDQISITEEGILAAFKYAALVDHKFVVKIDEETKEQYITSVDKYERTLEVDEITGEITKDELALPVSAEEFTFYPPIQGLTGGDPFTCKDMDDANDKPALGHIIKVGKIHELTKGFDQVNTNDGNSCVKGLHLGGHYYVKGYGSPTSYLLDCLVAPEDIGAVCDVNRERGDGSDGAIRCRRYMVTGGHFAVSKGMYHPSEYAKLLDVEWDEMKAEVIKNLNKQVESVEEKL